MLPGFRGIRCQFGLGLVYILGSHDCSIYIHIRCDEKDLQELACESDLDNKSLAVKGVLHFVI